MPYEIITEDEGKKVTTRYFGKITTSEVYAALDERFSCRETIRGYRFIIADYADVTDHQVSDVDIKKIVNSYEQAAYINPYMVCIGILPTDLLFGLGRMWASNSSHMPFEEIVFRTRKEAEEYLHKSSNAEFCKEPFPQI